MDINIETESIELENAKFLIAGTEVPAHQIFLDIGAGMSIAEISEEYELEESMLAQLFNDLSESFR